METAVVTDLSEFREAAPTEARYRGAVGRYFREVEEELVLDMLGDPGDVTLDLGCGTGRLFTALKSKGNVVFGTDISHDMLATAKRQPVPANGLVAGDFYRLPLAAGSLNTVIAVGTFHLTQDIGRVMESVSDALRPSGKFVFTCWNRNPWLPRRFFQGPQAAPHRIQDISADLELAGLKIERVTTTFFFPSYLFWAGCKVLKSEKLKSLWVDLAIRSNRFFLDRPGWRFKGAHFIVCARKI